MHTPENMVDFPGKNNWPDFVTFKNSPSFAPISPLQTHLHPYVVVAAMPRDSYDKEPCSTSALAFTCTISTHQFFYFYSEILVIASSKKMTFTLDFDLCGLNPSPMSFQSLCA